MVPIDEPLGAYRQHGENAWSLDASAPGAHLRRSLEHDAHQYRVLEIKARDVGMEVPRALGMRDHHHLATRLASSASTQRVTPTQTTAGARWHCVAPVASWHARLPWKRRAILAAWFIAVGFLPRSLAARTVAWRLTPASRPPGADRFLKTVRRLGR